MSSWNPKRDPEPEKKDAARFKEFIKQKYIEKRFAESVKDNSDNSSDEEERQAKRKARKEKKESKRK